MILPVGQRVVCIAAGLPITLLVSQQSAGILGRWVGESHCVGSRPACHDEHVIYQIDSTSQRQLTLQGSRIAGRDTVVMGALSCERATPEAEVICRMPVGTWHFSVAQGRLEGFLRLADSTVMRRVVAYRAQPNTR